MTVLPILTGENNPVLRKKTKRVDRVTKEIVKLLKDMEETTINAKGAGIAAPQVNRSERLCLAMINKRLTPIINPEITWRSEETNVMEEGCLSLPDVWLNIERSIAITLTYMTANGRKREVKLEGFDARVVQHEVDHLEGILIVDYKKTT